MYRCIFIPNALYLQALRLLLTILLVFFLCWTPQQSLLIWDVYRPRNTKLPGGIRSYVYWAYYVAYSSTCLYPIIYMSFNKSFRHALKNLISPRRQDVDLTTISPGKVQRSKLITRLCLFVTIISYKIFHLHAFVLGDDAKRVKSRSEHYLKVDSIRERPNMVFN
ncbi:hypothetical protein FSP39_018073 [Pinctada imbricata]|uniref:G-protein coupled receptors family 1 profile domain-containing protein n=1 Tax=Pinctada imbricata TaxID=66713 RepID=A0AA89BUF1_PINIB|nr:hypothetical protein FSP39_018073 [Pinctada imbricata]